MWLTPNKVSALHAASADQSNAQLQLQLPTKFSITFKFGYSIPRYKRIHWQQSGLNKAAAGGCPPAPCSSYSQLPYWHSLLKICLKGFSKPCLWKRMRVSPFACSWLISEYFYLSRCCIHMLTLFFLFSTIPCLIVCWSLDDENHWHRGFESCWSWCAVEISCAFFLFHTRCLGLSRHPGCLQGTKIAHEPTVTNTLKLIHFQVLSFTAISLAVAGWNYLMIRA